MNFTEECSFDQLYEFLVSRIRAIERVDGKESASISTSTPSKQVKAHVGTVKPGPTSPTNSSKAQATSKQDKSYPCSQCQEPGHFIVMCPRFKNASTQERKNVVVNERLCYNCLGRHSVRNCRSSIRCKVCGQSHHTMIHPEDDKSKQTDTNTAKLRHHGSVQSQGSSLLATAMAYIVHSHGTQPVRILIDPGSEVSFVTSHIVNSLALKRTHSSVPVSDIGGNHSAHTRGKVTIAIKSMHRDMTVQFSADILNKISSSVPSSPCDERQWSYLNGLRLADPTFGQPRHIDVLIGADVYPSIIKPNIIRGGSAEPMAHLSIFGWLVIGPTGSSPIRVHRSLQALVAQDGTDLDELLMRFWTQEEVPISSSASLTHEEALCEDHFVATHSRDSTGRYIVRLPLKQPETVLGDSLSRARACLRSILTKQDRDPEYKELYKIFMQEYAQLGHMTQVSAKPSTAPAFYLPHHGVLKLDNVTTKLRVVFNGSAATSSGRSLNDIMYAGPNLLLNIVDVLMWIRSFRLLFATDITKMYRQILVDERDVDLQRIVWVDENSAETHWQLKTVTYGTRAAPFLAIRSLLQLVKDEGHRFPSAVDSLTRGRYVDDIFGGADNDDQLKLVAQDLTNLCMAGGFPLAKWSSNSAAFRAKNATRHQFSHYIIGQLQGQDSWTLLGYSRRLSQIQNHVAATSTAHFKALDSLRSSSDIRSPRYHLTCHDQIKSPPTRTLAS
ncbi:unnamed protein product [Trichogramma brassicae]|uniref:CCHC-type domain-containing protein n=1 Tax=Trichogramma brassicae TaxID=86971 RepID=A0A6H5IVV6_9HYME|nr:unnamed protein product [Trichogramma brassicae]